jgi:uncharacterized membrane protein YeiB/ABC-type multidrug transport system ATPase subunit
MAKRILSLDLIRGFALAGVLAVNAAYFAAPLSAVVNPGSGPLAVSGGSAWSWLLPYVLFEYKSMALFSMLFGASLYLVGGERGDVERSRVVRRRLAWLALFGAVHGIFFWFGDILLSYAVAGAIVLPLRSWAPRRLLILGLSLFALTMGLIALMAGMVASLHGRELAAFLATSWSPPSVTVAAEIAAYRSGFANALAANFGAWVEFQVQTLLFLTARTAGLMMIGLAAFKTGLLSGELPAPVYRRWLAIGGAALAILAWNGWDILRLDFPMARMQATGTLVTATLAPLVALGYAGGLILLLRTGRAKRLVAALAAAGRMAFTNYLLQSVLMSTLFWSGRGFGLYGQLSRPQVMIAAALLFAGQLVFSTFWLRRFEHGPLERLWRGLSLGRKRAPAPAFAAAGDDGLAIESHGLARRFGAIAAVDGIDLQVPAGAIYAFLGANGSGKTTTIRMLLGLTRPSAGSVRIFGHDVAEDRIGAARSVGALLEARATYDHLSGRANLDLTRQWLGLKASEVDRVLELVDLRAAADRKMGHYSLGKRQRLGLARALLGTPKLLLLDEPMNGLDPEGIVAMRETIRTLPERAGATIFLSSHLLAEIEPVATHVGVMRQGRLVAQGPVGTLLGAADLIVRTGADAQAGDLLGQAGLAFRPSAEGLVVPGQGEGARAAAIARLLVEGGVAVHALAPHARDLESLYFACSARAAA